MNSRSASSLAVTVLVAVLVSGCASITGTTNQSVSIQTREQAGKEVVAASCELTNQKGKWFITSPGSVTVTRSNDDMQILCTKRGYEPGRASVVSATKGSMFGNLLLGGGVGALIDHNTGAAYEYPTLLQIVMGMFTKIEPSKAPEVQAGTPSTGSGVPAGQATGAATALQDGATSGSAGTREEQLRELRRLSDAGLISQEVVIERQRRILD